MDRQSRMFFIVGRIYMPSAVFFAVFTLGFGAWFNISEHMHSCSKQGWEAS